MRRKPQSCPPAETAGPYPTDPRIAAFQLLRDTSAGAYADRAAAVRLRGLSTRDRALAQELAFGALRLRTRLDTELEDLLARPLARVEPTVREWLRLGLYQLREMRVPDHAAVHETVEGVRRTLGPRPTSLVNGVLRAAARRGAPKGLFPTLESDPVAYLTAYGSHPEWLVRRWIDRWPLADVVRLVENDNRPPPVTFRLLEERAEKNGEAGRGGSSAAPRRARPREARSTGGAGREAAGGAVRVGVGVVENWTRGVEVEPLEEWPGCFRLVSGDPAELLGRTKAVFQDPAASAVVEYVASGTKGPILDMCAAPGGKAIGIAFAAPWARPFVAADVDLDRARRLAEVGRRTGADVAVIVADGRRPAVGRAATVLIDAPCTGTGVLRRRPDARWRIAPERLASLVRLQRELLDAGAGLVEPGGLLVYATCSLEPEENELQVKSFLDRHPDFTRDARPELERLPAGALTESGELKVLPWRFGTDGSYACRLRRSGA
ncbi:MAG: RsmB/NOP family class I SAM-dependent RNA methyltransferase [Gemmatimonadota bacterium]